MRACIYVCLYIYVCVWKYVCMMYVCVRVSSSYVALMNASSMQSLLKFGRILCYDLPYLFRRLPWSLQFLPRRKLRQARKSQFAQSEENERSSRPSCRMLSQDHWHAIFYRMVIRTMLQVVITHPASKGQDSVWLQQVLYVCQNVLSFRAPLVEHAAICKPVCSFSVCVCFG